MFNMHLCIQQGMYMHTLGRFNENLTTLIVLSQKGSCLKIEFEVKRPSVL